MSKITNTDNKFKDTVNGCFYSMLRAAGITMTPASGLERIREIANELADAIEYQAEKKSVEVIRILQKAVSKAFTDIESDFDKLKTEHTQLKARLDSLEKKVGMETFKK